MFHAAFVALKKTSRGVDYKATVMRLCKTCFVELDVQISELTMASEMGVG